MSACPLLLTLSCFLPIFYCLESQCPFAQVPELSSRSLLEGTCGIHSLQLKETVREGAEG